MSESSTGPSLANWLLSCPGPLPDSAAWMVAASPVVEHRRKLASRSTNQVILARLAVDPEECVRATVLANQSSGPEVLAAAHWASLPQDGTISTPQVDAAMVTATGLQDDVVLPWVRVHLDRRDFRYVGLPASMPPQSALLLTRRIPMDLLPQVLSSALEEYSAAPGGEVVVDQLRAVVAARMSGLCPGPSGVVVSSGTERLSPKMAQMVTSAVTAAAMVGADCKVPTSLVGLSDVARWWNSPEHRPATVTGVPAPPIGVQTVAAAGSRWVSGAHLDSLSTWPTTRQYLLGNPNLDLATRVAWLEAFSVPTQGPASFGRSSIALGVAALLESALGDEALCDRVLSKIAHLYPTLPPAVARVLEGQTELWCRWVQTSTSAPIASSVKGSVLSRVLSYAQCPAQAILAAPASVVFSLPARADVLTLLTQMVDAADADLSEDPGRRSDDWDVLAWLVSTVPGSVEKLADLLKDVQVGESAPVEDQVRAVPLRVNRVRVPGVQK